MTVASPPERKPDRHYDFRKTNIVFAFSALAFLAVTLLMVLKDYGRPWKRTQAEFRDLERKQIVAELEQERQTIDQQQIATVQQEIATEEQSLAAQRDEISGLESEIATLDKRVFSSDKDMRARKSELDAAKYRLDRALNEGDEDDVTDARATVDALTADWRSYQRLTEEFIAQREEVQGRLDGLRSSLAASERRLADLNSALTGLDTRLATVAKDLDYFMLNAPLLDFLAPSLKIEQVIVKGLYHDINFAKIDRVDRCMTCHVAATRAGFDGEEWAEPYRSHPRLDIFVADSSPHPYSEFGCTACHAGLDRATDFSRAGHSPVSDEQQHRWERDYGWVKQKYLEAPVKQAPMSEAGCLSCHADEVWTPGSLVLDKGRQIINKAGCYGCHAIGYEAFRDLPKSGPDLAKVASKLTPAFAAKWIEEPRAFRPTTWMPHFFYQENIAGDANLAMQRAEIESLVDYLWSRSATPTYPKAPAGDAARGEQLFWSVGCGGCHIMDADASREDYLDTIERLHGPNLAGVGSKLNADWMFAWVKNPKAYRPDSSMPNLRLTDGEAADIVAFLAASRNPAYEGLARQSVDPGARADLVRSYLRNTMTLEQADARVAEMSESEQSVYLGSETVAKYGCFGCHNIPGYENVKPIGVELTEEASKPLHLFDFGHQHDLPHTHHAWLGRKLQRPRSFDQGKELVLNYEELARMPNFGFSDRERDLVLTNLLGFTKESVREERKAGQGEHGEKLAAGRRVVTRYNCQGCHLIEGKGHAIRASLLDENNLPPNLASQGHRTQSDWLFGFLKDPSTERMRPWLQARMPTFEFSDEEANTLLAYFAELDGEDPFASPPTAASPRNLAVGGEIFGMLQCAKCHPSSPAAVSGADANAGELAPSLLLATRRLRHDWVDDWIKDPQRFIPGTKMPTNFPQNADGSFMSPLGMAVNQATFAAQKARMMRHFDTEAELLEFLGDVDKVTGALRDHIWTLSN